jgi:hypothetical protein
MSAEQYLQNNPLQDCIVCGSDTLFISKCCSIAVCCNCYTEWLKTSRECMHCHKDQMDFQEWVTNFRVQEDPPVEIIGMTTVYDINGNAVTRTYRANTVSSFNGLNDILNYSQNSFYLGDNDEPDFLNMFLNTISGVNANSFSNSDIANIYTETMTQSMNDMMEYIESWVSDMHDESSSDRSEINSEMDDDLE